MDLTIKKDYRNKGKYFNKIPPMNASKTKRAACSDMVKSKFFTKDYIYLEYLVLQLNKYEFEYYTLDLNKY